MPATSERYLAWLACPAATCAFRSGPCGTCRGTGRVRVEPPTVHRARRSADRTTVEPCGGVFYANGDRTSTGMWASTCDRCGHKIAGTDRGTCPDCDGSGRYDEGEPFRWAATVAAEPAGTFIVAGMEECPHCGSTPEIEGRAYPEDFE